VGEEARADADIVSAARIAASRWAAVGLPQRIERIRALRHSIVERMDDIKAVICEDTGKVEAEALLTDLLPTLEQCLFYEKTAPRVLRPETRRGTMLFSGSRAHVEYIPYGVVLVIVPLRILGRRTRAAVFS